MTSGQISQILVVLCEPKPVWRHKDSKTKQDRLENFVIHERVLHNTKQSDTPGHIST